MAQIDKLLKMMVEMKASDFHLSANCVPMFRRNGKVVPMEGTKELPGNLVAQLVDEIMPELNKKEFHETWDTDFAYEIAGLARFRGNAFIDHKGVGAVFRQIPTQILSAEDLGLPPVCLKFCKLSKGLVVVTGPTGSGKSTTLAAMIDYINSSRPDHIITVEDPIEFVHPNKKCLINQRQVGRHTKSFKAALKAALREDPDIILVGEMRDVETTEIALEMAETGHLVFGTLHTNTATSTIDRVINQFPSERQGSIRAMLADSLKGVIAQTLLSKKDDSGRVAAHEVLYVTGAISNNIRDGKVHQIVSSIQTGRRLGMQLLNDALIELVKSDTVDAKEAYLKSVDKDDMMMRLKQAGKANELNPQGQASGGESTAQSG